MRAKHNRGDGRIPRVEMSDVRNNLLAARSKQAAALTPQLSREDVARAWKKYERLKWIFLGGMAAALLVPGGFLYDESWTLAERSAGWLVFIGGAAIALRAAKEFRTWRCPKCAEPFVGNAMALRIDYKWLLPEPIRLWFWSRQAPKKCPHCGIAAGSLPPWT